MFSKILSAAAILFSGPIPALADEGKTYWALEDAAPVRVSPKPQAALKFCLRIGASFYTTKRSDGWLYVTDQNSPEFSGWVQAASVTETKVDSLFILGQISQSKTFADSLKWCESMVGWQPDDKGYLKALQKGFTATGDTARAAHYGRQLRGTNTVYLAQYDGEAMRVIGSLDSAGNFQPLLWKESPNRSEGSEKYSPIGDSNKVIRKKALGLKSKMAAMLWYQNEFPIWHKDRMNPFLWASDKFKGEYEDIEGTATFGLNLGIGKDGFGLVRKEQIFATKPFYRVPVSGIKRTTEFDSLAWYGKKLVGTAFDTLGMSDIHFNSLDEYGYVDIVVGGVVGAGRVPAEQRGIFDMRRNRVWPSDQETGTDLRKDEPVLKPAPYWFRFGPGAGSPAFIILPFTSNYSLLDFETHNGDFGYHLLRVSKSGFKSFIIRSDYAGD